MWSRSVCYSISPAVASLEEFTQLSSQGRSMNVIVNGQSSEVHETNTVCLKDPLVDSTLFLLYINGMPKNILRLLVNNYVYDTCCMVAPLKIKMIRTW